MMMYLPVLLSILQQITKLFDLVNEIHLIMRLIITFFVFMLFSAAAYSQSWKITTKGKTLLKANTENEAANKIAVKTSRLDKKGLNLCYTEGPKKQKDWERIIGVYDSSGKELKEQTGNSIQISRDSLRSYLKNSSIVKIYTWSLPTDPKLKALVRVRRIHLATISQQDWPFLVYGLLFFVLQVNHLYRKQPFYIVNL